MAEHIQISAKDLGKLKLADYCPRCFWLKQDRKGHIPYDAFPSIFGKIDRFTKNAVHQFFDEHGEAPPYLSDLGKLTGYEPPPKQSWFRYYDKTTDVTLTGEPDALFVCEDKSFIIADYKTAKLREDPLLPMYQVQVNVYGFLAEFHDFKPVSGLHLIYAEPLTGPEDVKAADFTHQADGFALAFRVKTLPVDFDATSIPPLLKQVRELMDHETCPPGRPACQNCKDLDDMIKRAVVEKPDTATATAAVAARIVQYASEFPLLS